MLIALLYCESDRIAAAALACDQTPYGERYWDEIHPVKIERGSIFETAYTTVANPSLRQRLLQIGVDDSCDGTALAKELESAVAPDYHSERAA
jgi:hypothetical protein